MTTTTGASLTKREWAVASESFFLVTGSLTTTNSHALVPQDVGANMAALRTSFNFLSSTSFLRNALIERLFLMTSSIVYYLILRGVFLSARPYQELPSQQCPSGHGLSCPLCQ